MYVGSLKFWNEFKEKLQQHFSISCSEGVGSEISFLKRRLLRVEDGLALLPGSSIGKLIKVWEERFGKLRSPTTPALQFKLKWKTTLHAWLEAMFSFSEWLWGHVCTSHVIRCCFHGEGTFKLLILEGNHQLCSCASATS